MLFMYHVSMLWMPQHTTSLTTLFQLLCTMPMTGTSVLATGRASERLDGTHTPTAKLPNKSNRVIRPFMLGIVVLSFFAKQMVVPMGALFE